MGVNHENGVIIIYTVLLVDDSTFMRKWIINILHKTNKYTVIAEGTNGREALLQYHAHKPDIVMMDITMDEMDGIQALGHLISLYPGIKVIMCSSMGQESNIKECIKLGAKDFIIKPNFDTLIHVFDRVLQE